MVCPGCGSRDATERFLCPHEHLRSCDRCGLLYAPEYADPDEVYVDGYLFGSTPFGIDITHPEFQEFLTWVAHRRLDVIDRIVRPPGRFLDVGCGTGEVLSAARARGWFVQGAEPVADSASVAQQRGLDVRAALLEESGLPQHSYDVVAAFHVLEHMTDARSFLESVTTWARPGGYVVIEVPNFHSFHRRNHGRGASWPHLRQLEHVAHYTPATLEATLRRSGLQPVVTVTRTYLYKTQTLHQALDDLGLQRWYRVAKWLGKPDVQEERQALLCSQSGMALLQTIEAIYRLAKTGAVVLSIARIS